MTPHDEKDMVTATARSADSSWPFDDVENVDRPYKRDAKYREYFEHKKHQFREHDLKSPPSHAPPAPVLDHFYGFSDDPLLSQVGKFKTSHRFTKSIPSSTSSISSSYPEDNQILDLTEPLFYPTKQPGLASPRYREKVSEVTPGPGLFSVTSAHTATPLPHSASHQARPRPTPHGYASQPFLYGGGPSLPSLTTASPWQFSPTPYTAYSHSSQERVFAQPPTPAPHHRAVQHVTENNLGEHQQEFFSYSYLYLKVKLLLLFYHVYLEDSGYNSIEREFLGKYSDSFPRTPTPSPYTPHSLRPVNFHQEAGNIGEYQGAVIFAVRLSVPVIPRQIHTT